MQPPAEAPLLEPLRGRVRPRPRPPRLVPRHGLRARSLERHDAPRDRRRPTLVAPRATEANAYFSAVRRPPGKALLEDWLVFEVLGVFLGGLVGAYSAGRLKSEVIRGEGVSGPPDRAGDRSAA